MEIQYSYSHLLLIWKTLVGQAVMGYYGASSLQVNSFNLDNHKTLKKRDVDMYLRPLSFSKQACIEEVVVIATLLKSCAAMYY